MYSKSKGRRSLKAPPHPPKLCPWPTFVALETLVVAGTTYHIGSFEYFARYICLPVRPVSLSSFCQQEIAWVVMSQNAKMMTAVIPLTRWSLVLIWLLSLTWCCCVSGHLVYASLTFTNLWPPEGNICLFTCTNCYPYLSAIYGYSKAQNSCVLRLKTYFWLNQNDNSLWSHHYEWPCEQYTWWFDLLLLYHRHSPCSFKLEGQDCIFRWSLWLGLRYIGGKEGG